MPIMSLSPEEIAEILGPERESLLDKEVKDAISTLHEPRPGKTSGIKIGPYPRVRRESVRNIIYHVLKNSDWYIPGKGSKKGNATVRFLSGKDEEDQFFAIIRLPTPKES